MLIVQCINYKDKMAHNKSDLLAKDGNLLLLFLLEKKGELFPLARISKQQLLALYFRVYP